MDTRTHDDTVLLVAEDSHVAGEIVKALRTAGMRVERSETLEGARARLPSEGFSAVLVDTRLPDGPGYALAAELRQVDPESPVLLLARSGDPDDLLYVGRESGTPGTAIYDDLPVLCGRVQGLLQRSPSPASASIRCGPLALDRERRRVVCDGDPLPITPVEYRLLERLAVAGQDGASTESLLHAGWDRATRPSSNVVAVHIGNLRRKLERAAPPIRIEAIREFGYVLHCPDCPDTAQTASGSQAAGHR